ncbi:MAG: alpha/beta fold hydrolase [Deltaproteobacteria bacterium]|nr:alpha/beta fold hydrolase [Deltaproteobacteria bacterium]MBW2077578.1 alpha/beta fold hydrolase [Deltaproteobacteria bacterium]
MFLEDRLLTEDSAVFPNEGHTLREASVRYGEGSTMPFVTIDDCEIYYDMADFTKPWLESRDIIVLHHGLCRSSTVWFAWVPILSPHFPVLRIDARGCGRSSKPEQDLEPLLEAFTGDVFKILDALEMERTPSWFAAKWLSLVWAGDFNVAPEPIDVYDPEGLLGSIGYHPQEHKALAAVKSWGFVDVFRRHNPDKRDCSFWDYRIPQAFRRGLGWRVDHIWATECLADKSTGAWIDAGPRQLEKPSDHTFILAEFKL